MSLTSNYSRVDPDYQRLQLQQDKWLAGGKVPRKLRPLFDAWRAANAVFGSGVGTRLSRADLDAAKREGEVVVWGRSARTMKRTGIVVQAPRRARPRAATRKATKRSAATSNTASGADPPAEPPAPRIAPASVAPVLVTDAPAMASILAAVVGLTPRQLRDLVVERGIRHTRPGRNVYVRVDDLLAALGLSGASSATPPSTGPGLSEDEVVTLACSDEVSR